MTLRSNFVPVMQVTVHLRDIMEGADEYNRAWEEVISIKHAPVCDFPPKALEKILLCSACLHQVSSSSCLEIC